ncbi:MAG: hypothetical protein NUV57_00175 [archaeon]|nr:hypothetical protein [archaeon]
MFFKEQKGQSALEYLMTYGWALIVIVIVIAALVFLIQPSQVGGNTCSTTSGILITNHQLLASTDDLSLILSNQTAASLTNVDINVTGTIGGVSITDSNILTSLGTIQTTSIVDLSNLNIDAGPVFDVTPGSTYSLQVTFNYNDRDALSRTVTSTCNGTVGQN